MIISRNSRRGGVRVENVGAEFAAVVCTVAVLVEVLPICEEPLKVESLNVPVKLFFAAISARIDERCAAVSVIVFEPFESESPVRVKTVVLPSFNTSLCL